jgi:hypothetical protein
MISQAYTDGLERALARVVSDAKREADAVLAGFQARLAEAEANLRASEARHALAETEFERRVMAAVEERLAGLRDGRDGEQGPQGERGFPGERGEIGPQGERGDPGERGLDGAAGQDGRDGVDGAPGRDGIDGAPGRDGAPGERGPEGPMGKLGLCRAWDDGVHYEGDVVAHEGATWQAIRDTGRAPPQEDWRCLAERGHDGRDGQDGRGFTVRGTYDAEATYAQLDVVMVGGSSFVARYNDPGPCPGDGWQLHASRGSRGAPGEKGERGDKGERGERGQPGPAVVALTVSDDAVLTLTMEDGQEFTADLYPLLAQVAR